MARSTSTGPITMKTLLSSATLWRFLGGFAIGGLGVLALHPATATIF